MSAQLVSHKRMLTRHCNKLEAVLGRFKGENLETPPLSTETGALAEEREYGKRVQEALGVIEECTSKIEEWWQKYAYAIDNIDEVTKGEIEEFDTYSTRAEEALGVALDYTVILKGRLRSYTTTGRDNGTSPRVHALNDTDTAEVRPPTLPTLPIPSFSGNIWDWENFWTLFNANVHTQPIPALYKFNHLLNALKGEAYNALRRFQVTDENYGKAIQFLQEKYGNREDLIHKLIVRLENVGSRSSALKDQRELLEQLQAIVSQLKEKGEQVNSQWLIKQVLAKFPERIQRRVLEKRYSREGTLHMDDLLEWLDQIISTEEKIALHTSRVVGYDTGSMRKDRFPKEGRQRVDLTCMYCGGEHKAASCTKYGTPQQRANYLREHKLCFICASSQHATSTCKKRVCFVCQGRHHTSCCFKSSPDARSTTSMQNKVSASNKVKEKEVVPPKQTSSAATHQPSRTKKLDRGHIKGQESSVTQLNRFEENVERKDTFLPIGELTIMDNASRKLRKIAVLMDSGAECSFIDSKLAEELNLPILGTTTLRVRTFGSNSIKEFLSRKVSMEIWDDNGDPHTLELLTHEVLTSSLKTPPLVEEDLRFLHSLRIPVNRANSLKVAKPQVLLGCDQIWSLIRQDQTHVRLPSGLHLLPTRIGHLLTGQMRNARQITQVLTKDEGINEWDKCWSLDAEVHTLSMESSNEAQDEKTLWEKYWTLEQEGVEEFTSSEKEVQSLVDEAVLKYFRETIEKRDDGYYVRLPWKEIPSPLPDNRAIAWRRLISLWNSLQKNEELLEKYNDIFQEQERLEIIEKVVDERAPVNGRIHYLPHQAVLTPQKATTKLRVVFDASAHFKDSPSLNDALHRGPVILPNLYGLLLRFRVGCVALIADVEKAFLQVRLQEIDRDATRCLWLRDHRSPPSANNLQVYRFTRVTFGLLSSPFLLAATTHYHLDQYQNEVDLVEEIKQNLYVDNILLTADSVGEANRVYERTKEIFDELHMNLREFASNNEQVRRTFKEADKSKQDDPKVLGIKWKTSEDCLQITSTVAETGKVTKRTVASVVASIYDPMGWILPLLHHAKVFLQSLWKEKLEWDTPLPEKRKAEWSAILNNIRGFHKMLPRFIAARATVVKLITCADASIDAFAACTYIATPCSGNLVMAKGKLPSLKSKTTIPKMELNALTLAMRLTKSVTTQLASVISISKIVVLTDSEIVLSWVTGDLRHDAGPFIQNRVMEIHKILDHLTNKGYAVQLGHIPSQENPADCATRGLDKSKLSCHFWWTGPAFLTTPEEKWVDAYKPVELRKKEEENAQSGEEDRVQGDKVFTQMTAHYSDIFQQIGSLSHSKAKRVVVYVLRYIRNLLLRSNKKRKMPNTLSPILKEFEAGKDDIPSGKEMATASLVLVKQHQLSHLNPAIMKSLRHLNIYEDEWGILRCRGRLGKSALTEFMKFPMLVLQRTWLSQMIIIECHQNLHISISHTMAKVREKYWIPKLRAEVTKVIRRCIECQKFNNLPYKYPKQEDLPTRRVTRSRPFEHIGLDYFGPLSVKNEENLGKCYGAIITCLVTRLIHLDIVSDNSTLAFLHMLRRFFARRGVPLTITSDNAPAFALGDVILSECFQRVKNDPLVTTEISKRHIHWIYITPYAPWQGGVYERLIQSVKLAMNKSLGRSTPSREELSTLVVEIEGMLNTRPLTYVEADSVSDRVLRPIDFLQNEFEVPPSIDGETESLEDPEYLTPAERVTLQTKTQVIKALQSSCKMTEKFWQIWQTQYLTSLREKHQVEIGNKRGSRITPKKGQVVLIADALQPRHSWKLGRITELGTNKEGTVREAVVSLPSHRKIRRPLNLLIPLELDDEENVSEEEEVIPTSSASEIGSTKDESRSVEDQSSDRRHERYNFRPRRKTEGHRRMASRMTATSSLIGMICALMFIGLNPISAHEAHQTDEKRIRCVQGGVEITSLEQGSYEICAEEYCTRIDDPKKLEMIRFPASITLHEYEVQWKFLENGSLRTFGTVCPKSPFCDNIDCMFCSLLLFNPECWPTGAIAATAVILYFLVTGCYVFLYVPLVVGKPVRVVANGLRRALQCGGAAICRKLTSTRRRRAKDLVELLAVVATLTILMSTGYGCQQIDVFSHHTTVCNSLKGKRICKFQVSEILKINPFKTEACLRLSKNSTTMYEVRVAWKSLILLCDQETDYFTRDTEFNVISSKRCAHMGSCIGRKCADVNGSSLIKELAPANSYPGTTYCVASCGGPGCDCLWPGSGCLFYRVFAVPTSNRVYEVFHCTQWKEAAKVEITSFDHTRKERLRWITKMPPNVPVKRNAFSLTLSSITIPPTPSLNTPFIADDERTALWDSRLTPALICGTPDSARNLSCEMREDCSCFAAETQANCKCKKLDINAWFENLQHRLPVITPSVSFRRNTEGKIQAAITARTTSEIILTIRDELETEVMVSDAICTISNTPLTGCYKCAKGAEAAITCKSSEPTQAEVSCEDSSFTVPCAEQGITSLVRFTFDRARIGMICSVECGNVKSTFKLGGVLKFTHSAQMMMSSWLKGETTETNGFQWPDLFHIMDVFLRWYKTLVSALMGLALMLIATYIFIVTCGSKITSSTFRILLWFFRVTFQALCLPLRVLRCVRKKHRKTL